MAERFADGGKKRAVRFCRAHVLSSPSEDEQRQMNKRNRKFSARLRRFERWHRIVSKLLEFEGLINNYESASPEEVHALKEIHGRLYECYEAAKRYEEELRPYDRILR